MIQYLNHINTKIPIITIIFKKIIKNPQKIINTLFNILKLKQKYISNTIKKFQINPYNNNITNNLNLKKTKHTISHQTHIKTNTIFKKYKLPKLKKKFKIPKLLNFNTTKFKKINPKNKYF